MRLSKLLVVCFILLVSEALIANEIQFKNPDSKKGICESTTLTDELSCATHKIYLKSKERVHIGLNYISQKYNSLSNVIPKTFIQNTIRNAKNVYAKVRHPSNLPPVISGPIKVIKYGNGIFQIVNLTVPGGFSDPDGTIEKITWNFGDGTQVTQDVGEFTNTGLMVHLYQESDHYTVYFTVEDDLGLTTTVSTYVETPSNIDPSFSITAFNTAANNFTFQINPEDQDGSTFNYETTLCGSTHLGPILGCAFAGPGNYTMFTRVTDSKGVSAEGTTVLTVNGTTLSATPVPIGRANTYFGEAPLTVNFDASKSFDINGQIVSYRWNFGDPARPKNTATTQQASHTFTKPGQYSVQLFVRDNDNIERSVFLDVYVKGTNDDPVILAGSTVPRVVNFNNTTSAFPVVADYRMFWWDFGNGIKASNKFMSHTYLANGTYDVKLKIIDILGATYNLEKSITVGNTNDSPTSVPTLDQYEPFLGQTVYFSAENSTDPGQSQPLTYRWVFDDGDILTGETISKTFYDKGLMNVDLWVTNTRGISWRNTVIMQVRDRSSNLDARLSYDPKVGYGPLTINLDSSATTTDAPITYQEWIFNNNNISNNATTQLTVTNPGTYYFRYYVENAYGDSSMAFGDARVLSPGSIPPGNLPPVAIINMNPTFEDPRVYHSDCNSSSDPNDYVAYCSWKINGTPAGDDRWLSFEFRNDITYTVELTVTDSWGAQNTVYRNLDFSGANTNLITFDHSPIVPVAGMITNFGADRTRIIGKDIKAFDWNFGDSTTANGRFANHTYSSTGAYTVVLTVTDTDDQTYTFSKIVNVTNTSAFDANLYAQDSSGLTNIINSDDYSLLSTPEKVTFTAVSKGNSLYPVVSAVWDLGDGHFAYGPTIQHTYKRPGNFSVSVTLKDLLGTEITRSFTVKSERNHQCLNNSGDNTCFSQVDANDLSLATGETWILNNINNYNFSHNPAHYSKEWVTLKTHGHNQELYDISNAVTVNGNLITINKNKISSKANLALPHEVKIQGVDTNGSAVVGSWPKHYAGNLKYTVESEEGSVVRLYNPSAQIKKEIQLLGSSTTAQFSKLPAGDYVVITEKNGISNIRNVRLGNNGISQLRKNFEKKISKKLNLKTIQNFQTSITGQDLWTHSLCGETTPFPVARIQALQAGEMKSISFSSSNPTAASAYRTIPGDNKNFLNLSCGIKHPGLLYGQNKWKYFNGPKRCWNNSTPHTYWSKYLKTLESEDSPITIKYELKDEWTNQKTLNHIVTSASGLMNDNGLNIEDLTARIGLPTSEAQDWSQRMNISIPIPPQFTRPQVRFELYSHHDSNPESFYSIECDVLTQDNSPRISHVTFAENETSLNSKEDNGRKSLSGKYGLFPVQYDGRESSPESVNDEISTATYKVMINYGERSDITWQAAKVKFRYGDSTHEEIYDFEGPSTQDDLTRIYTNLFTINISDLENTFSWIPGVSDVELEIIPLGRVLTDHDYSGVPKKVNFKALFDLQSERNSGDNICFNGFFEDYRSSYATSEMLALLSSTGLYGQTRCGSASLPFGGPFVVDNNWTLSGHKFGNDVDLRSFNDLSTQDQYDSLTGVDTRISDLSSYMNFSEAIQNISNTQYEYIGGNPTNKKLIADYCSSEELYPCSENTNFSNITREMIHGVCLLYSTETITPEGCPSADLTKLKRFSSWAQHNRNILRSLGQTADYVANTNTGWNFPINPTQQSEWQKVVLQEGKWPDGMPIYEVDEILNIFTPNRLNNDTLNIQYGTAGYGVISLATGWN